MIKLLGGEVNGHKEAEEILNDKLSFIEEWLTDSFPEVHVAKVLGDNELFQSTLTFKMNGKVEAVKSEPHNSLLKTFDELAEIAKPKISKEKDKLITKRRKRKRDAKEESIAELT